MANKDHQPVRGLRWWWSKWWVRLPIAIVGVISWLQTFAWMVKWIRTHHGELLIFGPSAAVAFVLAVFGFIALVIALGPERVTAWVDHFRGHAPALQETSTTREASEPEEAPESDERTFIDVTPAYLVGLFEGHTDLHTLKLTEPFVGKWMKVSGPLGNVLSNRETMTTSSSPFTCTSTESIGMIASRSYPQEATSLS